MSKATVPRNTKDTASKNMKETTPRNTKETAPKNTNKFLDLGVFKDKRFFLKIAVIAVLIAIVDKVFRSLFSED